MLNSVTFAVYCGDGRIEDAFMKVEEMFLSNYGDDRTYGVVADLPPSVTYRAAGDDEMEKAAEKELGMLEKKYGERFFCLIRSRRYSAEAVRKGIFRYWCEDGFEGAIKELENCFRGGETSFYIQHGDITPGKLLVALDTECWGEKGEKVLCCDVMYRTAEICSADSSQCHSGKPSDAAVCIARDGSLLFSNRGKELFTVIEKVQQNVLTDAERFMLKGAATVAAKWFFQMYDGAVSLPDTAWETLLALGAVVAMKMFGNIGSEEALELSERLIGQLRRIIAVSDIEGGRGEDLLLITAVSEGFGALPGPPSFILLKNELLRLRMELIPRAKLFARGNICGALCCKELKFTGECLNRVGRILLFPQKREEFCSFVSGILGQPGTEFNAEVLIRAVQLYYDMAFFQFLMKNREFRAKYGLLRSVKLAGKYQDKEYISDTSEGMSDKRRKAGLYSAAGRVIELVERSPSLTAVRVRMMSAGSSGDSLLYAAYLDACLERQKGRTEKSVCFACDEIGELIYGLAEAAKAVPELNVRVISRDRYGVKALKIINPCVSGEIYTTPEVLKLRASESGYFRQLTPASTLSELMREINT